MFGLRKVAWAALAVCLLPMGVMAEEGDVAPVETQEAAAQGDKPGEGNCTDGIDNDGDSVPDCADADCFEDPACAKNTGPENTNALCSDWVDNDGDGHIDCDDTDCNREGIEVCQGSWVGPLEPAAPAVMPKANGASNGFLPDMKEGMTVEDLIGSVGDNDGERNDYLCSDGLDNDGDGAVDCADYGCRFDTTVSVCQASPGMRFSVVAGVGAGWEKSTEYEYDSDSGEYQLRGPDPIQTEYSTNFEFLQLRALGPIPLIQDSFFLISSRAEKDFRITFAMFQIPVLGGRHRLNVNSGGGGLSQALVISQSKQLLLAQPYYLYNAFDQGNGAAVELNGPVPFVGKRLNYRGYVAGGTGRWGGSIGGQYVGEGYNNYTWSAGGQLGINIFGLYSRFDNPFLYTPVPLNWGIAIGAKHDQRNDERYDAMNIASTFRWKRVIISAESYGKHELNYDFYGLAYNVTAGLLVWPKRLMLAADFGEYMLLGLTPELIAAAQGAGAEDSTDAVTTDYDVRRERSERQWRAAAHFYFYRNIGLLSLVYTDNTRQTRVGEERYLHRQELNLTAQYRF